MMRVVRNFGTQRIAALFLLAVICHTLALSGHIHRESDAGVSRTSCAVCAATTHVPALSPAPLPSVTLSPLAVTVPPAAVQLLLSAERLTRSSRAPPTACHSLVA
jgi:hypothetical protein